MTWIYKSIRVGQFGKPFTLYKFRTMCEGADQIGGSSTADDDPRITKIGRILRKTKIDELPQIWNLLKGDMGICGSRPEVKEVIDLMTEDEKKIILSVKPGLTDIASLWNFQEGETLKGEKNPHQIYLDKIWPTKKKLQILYIQNKSVILDLRIILQTILQLFHIKLNILPKNIKEELAKVQRKVELVNG